MNLASSQLAAFHMTGQRPENDPGGTPAQDLQPALFGHFHDLTTLRYDFPLLLDTTGSTNGPLTSLTAVIDGVLSEIAPRDTTGEKMRRQVLGLEQAIRNQLAGGQAGSLTRHWERAQRELLASAGKAERSELRDNLRKARESISCRGPLRNCDQRLPAALFRHVWAQGSKAKTGLLSARINYLVRKLEDVLQIDSLHKGKAHDAAYLQSSMGAPDGELFDFQAMSRVLGTAPVGDPLPEPRLHRIRAAISVLRAQSFVASKVNSVSKPRSSTGYKFEFNDCTKAMAAFRKRLPDMAELIKAISIAGLEIGNRYDETRHGAYFKRFDENSLGPEDLALFPTYLVCLVGEPVTAKLKAEVLETLGSGLPIKVMVQYDDILEPAPGATGQMAFGVRGQQLARMALGLNKVFVMQAASSSFYRLGKPLLSGLTSRLPALFSVYSGDPVDQPGAVAPYLNAAAAIESRAFPCFVSDPDQGEGWAQRFSLEGNPQVETNWASHPLQFEDSQHTLMSDDLAFTLIDFIASDARQAEHFITVPQNEWFEGMLPVAEYLDLDSGAQADKVPYTLLLTGADVLQRAVVDDRLIDAAVRCQESWRGVQELAGINNSHVMAALAEAAATRQQEKEQLLRQAARQPGTEASTPPSQPAASLAELPPAVEGDAADPADTAAVASDEPWIETPRCTTCNECTELNNRMFAYNDDMQAFIADPAAGTYRELIEAAEACQVAIIHPGKALNPDEPGLEALQERAEAFL